VSALSKTDLKAIYVSGARPSETNFHDLIDSFQGFSELLNHIATANSQQTGVLEIVSASATAHSILPTRLGGTGEGSLASASQALAVAGVALVASANVFTNTNTFSDSTAGSQEGPIIILDKPNSQSDGDNLGAILIKGADSVGASSTYAKMRGAIVSTSAGNENGRLELITVVSGNSAIRFNIGGGLYSNDSTDQGVDTISVPASGGYYHNATRMPIGQVVFTANNSQITVSDTVTFDDSTPLDSEGSAILSQDFTPLHPNSMLEIQFNFYASRSNTNAAVAFIVSDASTSAIYSVFNDFGDSDADGDAFVGHYFVSASSTNSRIYTLRAAPTNTGDLLINQSSNTSNLGQTPRILLKVTEHLP
jgi:hypothetical protein